MDKVMILQRQVVLAELRAMVLDFMAKAEAWQTLPEEALRARAHEKAWNVLECLEHLNRYGDFYLPQFEAKMSQAQPAAQALTYKTGWLGNYSAEAMLPQSGKKLNVMQTFKDKNPLNAPEISPLTIQRFLQQQKRLILLLEEAERYDLGQIRIPLTLKWLKFKLGDTLRFLVFHEYRHILQAERALVGTENLKQKV